LRLSFLALNVGGKCICGPTTSWLEAWRMLGPSNPTFIWAAPARVPSLVLRLKLFAYSHPVEIALKLTLETDMLEPGERPPVEQQLAVEAALQLASESPWEKPTVEHVIRRWAHALDSRAEYRDVTSTQRELNGRPFARYLAHVVANDGHSQVLFWS
jgi:hypothetical protein